MIIKDQFGKPILVSLDPYENRVMHFAGINEVLTEHDGRYQVSLLGYFGPATINYQKAKEYFKN